MGKIKVFCFFFVLLFLVSFANANLYTSHKLFFAFNLTNVVVITPPPTGGGGGYVPDFCGDSICSNKERSNNSCPQDCNRVNLSRIQKELAKDSSIFQDKANIVSAQEYVILVRLSDEFRQGRDAWVRVLVLNYLGQTADVDGVVLKVRGKDEHSFTKSTKKSVGAFQFDFTPLNITEGVYDAQLAVLKGNQLTASDTFPLIVKSQDNGIMGLVAEFFDSVWSFLFGKS